MAESDAGLLLAALEASHLLVMIADAEGLVSHVNRAVSDATGFAREACLKSVWELVAFADERALLRAAFSEIERGAFPAGFLSHMRSSGERSPLVVDWSTQVIRRDRERPAVVFAGVDLSERLRTQASLQETEARQRVLLERLPAVVWSTDRDLRFTTSAGAGLRQLTLGTDQVALLGTSIFSYFHTSDRTMPIIDAHLRALNGERVTLDVTWLGRLFQSCVEPLVDVAGRTVGCIGVALDVTERHDAEQSLRMSEARFRRLFDSNMIGIAFWSRAGRVVDANGAFLELVGFSAEDVVSGAISWRDMTPPEYAPVDQHALQEIDARGTCTPFEKEYVCKDGTRVPVLVGGASLDTPSTESAASGVAFALDLREQVRLRALRDELLARERRARMETEWANARILLLAEAGKELAGTLRTEDTLSILAEVVVPGLADWSVVVHREWEGSPRGVASAHADPSKSDLVRRLHEGAVDPDALEGAARVFRSGDVAVYANVTEQQLSPDAPEALVVSTRDPAQLQMIRELGLRSLLCLPVHGRSGVEAVLMLVAAFDPQRYDCDAILLGQEIASRAAVSLENGHLLGEALEAVRARDEFLSVAAHELRTPLTSILLQLQRLERMLEDHGFDQKSALQGVETAGRQARSLAALVENLLDVSRLATDQLAVRADEVNLAQVVREAVTMMDDAARRAGCSVDVSAPESVIGRYDRVRMGQVVTNLLANALKFGQGGPVEVGVKSSTETATLSIRDHGIGILPEDRARIFGRFERAISSRHFGGLGLGLYISAQIVRAHGGSLRVESEPGEGALFVVELPRH